MHNIISFRSKDYEKWKSLNKDKSFSLYDYIFHIMKMKEVNFDIYFAFRELFWPNFIEYKGLIFLKEKFSENKFYELIKQNESLEYWMNLFLVDPFFENEEDKDEKSETFAKSLVEIWKAKLTKDFPNKRCVVEYLFDKENGDFGLTFYQKSD